MKIQKARRKFYNKWTYKVSLRIPGISFVMRSGCDTRTFYKNILPTKDLRKAWWYDTVDNKDIIVKLEAVMSFYNKDDWGKRIERNNIDIYTNDEKIFNCVIAEFENEVDIRSFKFDTTLGDQNGYVIPTRKLPHGKYQYKVYLKPHAIKNDKEARQKYIGWVVNQKKISITTSVKDWFMTTDWNWDPRYIWVEDEKTLLMLKLRNPVVCGRIYEYRLVDK